MAGTNCLDRSGFMIRQSRILFIIILLFTWISAGHSKTVRTAFRGECETILLKNIQSAKFEILVAVYSFSNKKIARALIKKSKEGISVKLKVDKKQASYNYSKSVFDLLKSKNLDIEYISMLKHHSMHNKFVVIDKKTVLTGSYNFTKAATHSNWENLVQITDKMIALKYIDEWNKIQDEKSRKK